MRRVNVLLQLDDIHAGRFDGRTGLHAGRKFEGSALEESSSME